MATQKEQTEIKKGDWAAYCLDCQTIIESCRNGAFAQAAAHWHLQDHPDHTVLLGMKHFN